MIWNCRPVSRAELLCKCFKLNVYYFGTQNSLDNEINDELFGALRHIVQYAGCIYAHNPTHYRVNILELHTWTRLRFQILTGRRFQSLVLEGRPAGRMFSMSPCWKKKPDQDYQAALKLAAEVIVWIRCIAAGSDGKHAGRRPSRTGLLTPLDCRYMLSRLPLEL